MIWQVALYWSGVGAGGFALFFLMATDDLRRVNKQPNTLTHTAPRREKEGRK